MSDFKPVCFYSPGSSSEDPGGTVWATTEDQAEYLRAHKWLSDEEYFAARRERERAEEEEAQRAAEAARVAAIAAGEQEARAREADEAGSSERAAAALAKAEAEAKRAAINARINFLANAANAEIRPLEDRRRAIHSQCNWLASRLSQFSDQEREAGCREYLDLCEEERDIDVLVAAINDRYRVETAEVGHAG